MRRRLAAKKSSRVIGDMKPLTFDEARQEFERIFKLAANGETIVIERDEQRVTLQRLPRRTEPDIAPPDYFAADYSTEEAAELNALASHAPQMPLP